MDCRTIQSSLDEYRDDLLSQSEQSEFQAHLAHCADCREKLARLQLFVDSVQRLPVIPARPGFAEQALLRARDVHHSNPIRLPAVMKRGVSWWFATGIGGALAATVLVWVVGFLPKPIPPGLPAVEFGLNQTRSIQLAFDSPAEFHGVTLTVVVPANFQIANRVGVHSLSWRTDLRKGANVLTLPVVAIQSGDGDLVARLNSGREQKTFRVPMSAAAKIDHRSVTTNTD